MNEYREKSRVVEDEPIRRARPVVETQYDSVIHERHGMSGGAVTALVLASIAAAVVVTMLIINNQQRNTDEQLAQERAQAAAAEQSDNQQPAQQPPVIVVPPSQPSTVPVPVPSQPAPTGAVAPAAPTNSEIELAVNSKFLDDPDLRSAEVDVKVTGGTAVLSGHTASDDLKARAANLAKTVKGVHNVVNNIVVKPTNSPS